MISMETVCRLCGNCMEFVWRLYGDNVERDTFHGDFMVRYVWRWYGFSWRKHGK